jgi:hypothetical protein
VERPSPQRPQIRASHVFQRRATGERTALIYTGAGTLRMKWKLHQSLTLTHKPLNRKSKRQASFQHKNNNGYFFKPF